MRPALARFEKIDLAEERSCDQLLELMRAYRPESVVHLAFMLDPLRSGVVEKKRMWRVNVAGTSRVTEAIAEHNRMLGGIDKFIFPSSALVYGPELSKPVTEDAPLNAQSLPYALHQQEADRTVQSRAKGMKIKVYILRPHVYAGRHRAELSARRAARHSRRQRTSRLNACAAKVSACRCGCLRVAAIWSTNFSSSTWTTWRV